jgi:exosortase
MSQTPLQPNRQRFWPCILLPILAGLVFFALTVPVWRWLWSEWMSNDYYGHGLLIAPVALFLAVQRFRNDESLVYPSGSGNLYGVLLLAAALVGYLYFLEARALYMAAFAMVAMLAGLVWALGGTNVVRKLAFPLAYLIFMIPLPSWDRITLPLALFTGVCSGGLVQLLGLDVTVVGSAVSLPNADLVIGAQCSGVNSLIALTSLMVLVAYLLDGPVWSRIALVLLSIPLAVLGNILRVATLLFVARAWGAQAAFTYYHDYSGIFFFIGVLLLVYPLTRVLRFGQLRYEVI